MNRQSRFALVALIVLGLSGLFWWNGRTPPPGRLSPAAAAPNVRGGTLVASLRSEPRSFNRLVSRHTATEVVALLTHGRLVRVNRATQEVEPWLAERWTTSPDGLVYTLSLRDGLQWSDGQPFTAADVAFTFQAILDPKVKSVLASGLAVDGTPLAVATPDPRTVVVTFPKPFGPGIRLLADVVILPKHKLEAALVAGTMADAWTPATPPADIAGMGPFVLTRYEPGQRLTFARNPHYWRRDATGDALPYLDGLVLEILPDAGTELLRLGAGQLDLMQQQLPAADVASARELERKGLVTVQEAGVALDSDTFFFNLRPAVWAKDPRGKWLSADEFRQALSHAVDREAYANTVHLGAAVPVHGPITPGNKAWFWPDVPRYRFDQAKARELLTGLGLTNRDADPWLEDAAGAEARFTLLSFKSIERGAQVLKESFEAVGVAVDLVPLEPGALIERLLAGNFDAIFFNYTSSDTDPAMQADFWLSSGSGHFWNISEPTPATPWEAEIDGLMTRQATALDAAERTRLFREVQRVFAEHLPALYFAAPRIFMAVGARVRNPTPGVVPPQLLWSADTLSLAPGAMSR